MVFYSSRYDFALAMNAKCACTTLKQWFTWLEYEKKMGDEVHSFLGYAGCLPNYPHHVFRRGYPSLKCPRILVVRNPWKRLVSLYTNKFVREKRGWWIFRPEITFEELIRGLHQQKDNPKIEHHGHPQNSGLEDCEFDYIVRVENLSEGMAQVCRELNLPEYFPHSNESRREPKKIESKKPVYQWQLSEYDPRNLPSYEEFYSEELKELTREIYVADVERFGYEFED